LNQKAKVRIDNILSEEYEIGRGNLQGCPLSALLYILSDEGQTMIKKTVDGEDLGTKVGGECIHSVRFADDKAILSITAKGLQTWMSKLNDITEEYGKIKQRKQKRRKETRK